MNRRDRAVVGALVLVLVVLGVSIALPRPSPVAPPVEEPTPGPSLPPEAVYREGVVGVAESVTPVTARNRAERTLVGLVYSGLVKLGPGASYQPDLAQSWTSSADGTTWTFTIRDDAVWQDGEPVTADDVVYTIEALKSPDAAGGASASWADVTAEAVDEHTVVFRLDSPIAGFLAAATEPLMPAHLLADVPLGELATSEFARLPVGSGPYAITDLDGKHAVLVPTSGILPGAAEPDGAPSSSPSLDASASPSAQSAQSAEPSAEPSADAPLPSLDRIEVRFFTDEASLATAFQDGELDGAAGLTAGTNDTLSAVPGIARLRYPTTTLSTVLLNLRPGHKELRDPKVRVALLAAIDRDALVADVLRGDAVRADALVPPRSWAYDATSAGTVPYDPKAAAKLLESAGWTKKKGKLYAPGSTEPYRMELLSVPAGANPRMAAEAAFVRDSWAALGMDVGLLEVPVAELSTRLREGKFAASVIDIAQGLEPDLYPILASSQVLSGGSNLEGYQDKDLDKLLEAARAPGAIDVRQTAWKALLAGIAVRQPLLPLAWNDEVMLAQGVDGPEPRLIAHTGDRFWDVLAWRLAADR